MGGEFERCSINRCYMAAIRSLFLCLIACVYAVLGVYGGWCGKVFKMVFKGA